MFTLHRLLPLVTCLIVLPLHGQNLIGAWESTSTDDNGKAIKMVVIFAEGYQAASWFDAATGAFIATNGGTWQLEGETMRETVEFDTRDSTRVGTEVSFDIEVDDNTLRIVSKDIVFNRIDDGTPGDLAGAWLISGITRNGEMRKRDTTRPRKTMKILSGQRFQWIAYNTETKRFMGTGGGTYTTVVGKYTEQIEFFSRDDSRVGAQLQFEYDIKDGQWHHSGKSSKGDPLYEIWSRRM